MACAQFLQLTFHWNIAVTVSLFAQQRLTCTCEVLEFHGGLYVVPAPWTTLNVGLCNLQAVIWQTLMSCGTLNVGNSWTCSDILYGLFIYTCVVDDAALS